jgi:WhiB family redox-sensing transcriptional regulator
MLQRSTSMDVRWKSANDFFSIADHADVDDVPRYRSIISLMPEWHTRAACRTTSKSVFFGSSTPEERPAYTLTSIRKARAICEMCPVFNECLYQALTNREDYGLWAGTTMRQRKEIFRAVDQQLTTIGAIYDSLRRIEAV